MRYVWDKRLETWVPAETERPVIDVAVGQAGWPMVSEACAVHPSQVEAANARAKRHGVGVTYDRKGMCHIPDRAERRKLLRLEGYHDRNSFTGY